MWPFRQSFECGTQRPIREPVPQDVRTPLLLQLEIFKLFLSLLQCLRTCPWHRVTYKRRHLFHTNCRSVRHRGLNPGHLRGRQRRKPLSHPLKFSFLSKLQNKIYVMYSISLLFVICQPLFADSIFLLLSARLSFFVRPRPFPSFCAHSTVLRFPCLCGSGRYNGRDSDNPRRMTRHQRA
jgi:hypothetical protein